MGETCDTSAVTNCVWCAYEMKKSIGGPNYNVGYLCIYCRRTMLQIKYRTSSGALKSSDDLSEDQVATVVAYSTADRLRDVIKGVRGITDGWSTDL